MIKPVLHTIILLFTIVSLKAQENLVPNGSFEEYTECPTGNDLNNGQFEKVKYWWKPTAGTSDYFNRCNTGVVGVPDNFWGYQEAYHGDGYVGLVPMELYPNGNFVGAEYIQTKLKEILVPCHRYNFSMYISMADFSTHSVGRLGAIFSSDTNFYDNSTMNIISYEPQIVNTKGQLNDSINWMKVEGSFIADGSERFLTIGYFFKDITNDSVFFEYLPALPGEFVPYYYVDSISLKELEKITDELCEYSTINFPNVFTPNQDGINDVVSMEKYTFFVEKIIILNRWGNVVTTLTENDPYWNGEDCTDGIYYYIIRFKDQNKQQTGFIQLIR